MKKTLTLTKVIVKSSFNTMTNSKKKRKSNNKLNVIGIIALYIILSVSIFLMSKDLLKMFIEMGKEKSIINLVFLATTVYILIIATLTVPSIFYFSKDIEHLLSLPLRSEEILFAKTIATYINMLLGISFIMIPFGITYQYVVSPPLYFLLFYFVGMLILPVIPMAISIGVVVLIFRLIPKVNNKDVFTYITSLFMIVFIIGINLISTGDNSFVSGLIEGDLGVTQIISILIPTIDILANAISNSNVLYLVYGALFSGGFLLAVIKLVSSTYFKGAIGISEGSKKHRSKIVKTNKLNKKISSQTFTILKTDFVNILRTPTFMINYLMPILILPIFAGMPILIGIKSGEIPKDMIDELTLMVQAGINEIDLITMIPFAIIGSFAITFLMGSLSSITSTSISREGNRIKAYKVMPISMLTVINAKLILGIILVSIFPLFSLISLSIIFKLNIVIVLISLITILIAAVFSNVLDIITDIFYPKLSWDNETQAIKQNFLTIIPVFGSFAILGLFISIFVFFKNNQLLSTILILVLSIILTAVIYEIVIKIFGLKNLDKAIEEI